MALLVAAAAAAGRSAPPAAREPRAGALAAVAVAVGGCLAACREAQRPSCTLFGFDAETISCIQGGMRRWRLDAKDGGCPVMGGTDVGCGGTRDAPLSAIASGVEMVVSALYCDDGASRDGTSVAERADRPRLLAAGGQLLAAIGRCHDRAARETGPLERRDAAAGACGASRAGPEASEWLQHCVAHARARFVAACVRRDLPECLGSGCDAIATAIAARAAAFAGAVACTSAPERVSRGPAPLPYAATW